jgi:hypothetical protein
MCPWVLITPWAECQQKTLADTIISEVRVRTSGDRWCWGHEDLVRLRGWLNPESTQLFLQSSWSTLVLAAVHGGSQWKNPRGQSCPQETQERQMHGEELPVNSLNNVPHGPKQNHYELWGHPAPGPNKPPTARPCLGSPLRNKSGCGSGNVLQRTLQPKKGRVETHTHRIYHKELAHIVTETDKSQGVYVARRRPGELIFFTVPVWRAADSRPGRAHVSVWVPRPENLDVPAPAVRHKESPLLKAGSAFVLLRPSTDWTGLPPWGALSALLSLPSQHWSHPEPLSQTHPEWGLTCGLVKLTRKINHHRLYWTVRN